MPISRATVGRFQIYGISDAKPAPVDPIRSYPDVPQEAWEPHRRWLTGEGQFQPDLGCFVVRSPDGVVLIDAGIGPGPVSYLGDARGTLRESFGELGLGFDDVSAVIFTHLHFDHVGWASIPDASGTMRPSFPNARYFVGETEWAFWDRGPANVMPHHIDAFARVVRPVEAAGLLTVVPDGTSPIEGFAYRRLPGNTPGHQGVLATSGGHRCLFCADICHCPAQIPELSWSHRSDVDAKSGRATRQEVFSELVDTDTLLAFGHFPRGADLGHVTRRGDGFAWQPLGGN